MVSYRVGMVGGGVIPRACFVLTAYGQERTLDLSVQGLPKTAHMFQ